ncbi:hypothetical protein KIL84_003785 [Mauremys mutica]|uniref:Uncharacterized protein n=1 Tax=Mauremys mutica TaxID=74926 RepID=A0A9D3WWE7_9SAUR|nr:hypothetical protein KIL84_003785 [Mauremys mutica]
MTCLFKYRTSPWPTDLEWKLVWGSPSPALAHGPEKLCSLGAPKNQVGHSRISVQRWPSWWVLSLISPWSHRVGTNQPLTGRLSTKAKKGGGGRDRVPFAAVSEGHIQGAQ